MGYWASTPLFPVPSFLSWLWLNLSVPTMSTCQVTESSGERDQRGLRAQGHTSLTEGADAERGALVRLVSPDPRALDPLSVSPLVKTGSPLVSKSQRAWDMGKP